MLHGSEQIETKPPAVRSSSMNGTASENLGKERVAGLPRGVRIAQDTAEISEHRLIIRSAQFLEGLAAIIRIDFRQANTSPPRREKQRSIWRRGRSRWGGHTQAECYHRRMTRLSGKVTDP